MKLLSILLTSNLFLAGPLLADEELSTNRQSELSNLLIQDCGSCHGLKLKGGLGPPLLPDALSGKSLSYLSTVILQGRPGTAMPPWRELLTPAEAQWMANKLLQGSAL